MRTTVTVVGGGLAGLTAATTAARAGARVTLLEARTTLGGRARTHDEDGFWLNEGAHALSAGGAGISVLRRLGIEPAGRRPDTSPTYGRLRGRIGLLPNTPVEAFRSRLIGPRAKAQLARRLGRPAALLQRDTTAMSMAQWIDELVTDDDARLVVRMIARVATYTDDPATLAADAVVPHMVSALSAGVIYLDGGWQQLTDALTDAARAAGVEIVTNSKVTSIAELDGSGAPDAVIYAAGGPAQAATFLNGRSEAAAGWSGAVAVRAAALDLGLRRLPRPDRRVVFGVDEPLYLSTHTPAARLADSGGEVVHLLHYGAGDNARAAMESLLDDAQPGWRDHVVVERFSRWLLVAHDRPGPGRGLTARPPAAVPDYPGLFLAGDWVGPVGLLADAALASAHQAALLAIDKSPPTASLQPVARLEPTSGASHDRT